MYPEILEIFAVKDSLHNDPFFCWEGLNGGLANGGLRYLSTIVYDCLQVSSICDENSPLRKRPKRPQMRTIVDDCAQIAESGLKPPFESPHLDFPDSGPESFGPNVVSAGGLSWRVQQQASHSARPSCLAHRYERVTGVLGLPLHTKRLPNRTLLFSNYFR